VKLDEEFGEDMITFYGHRALKPGQAPYTFCINPVGESSFSVRLTINRTGFTMDGLPDQNARATVAIVDALGDIGPIVAVDQDAYEFINLVPRMKPDDIAARRGWESGNEMDRTVWA